jgi:hypothetical protein
LAIPCTDGISILNIDDIGDVCRKMGHVPIKVMNDYDVPWVQVAKTKFPKVAKKKAKKKRSESDSEEDEEAEDEDASEDEEEKESASDKDGSKSGSGSESDDPKAKRGKKKEKQPAFMAMSKKIQSRT